MPIAINISGNPSGDATNYGYLPVDPSVGALIYSTDFNPIVTAINSEVSRRGHGNPGYAAPGTGTIINHNYVNGIWAALTTMSGNATTTNTVVTGLGWTYYSGPYTGYTNAGVFNGVGANATIYAADINNLISFIQSAAAVCLCNCNYCTCNCNYCTCNCNYACTCNCNYSDQRLKENITLIGNQEGLNIYSFTYRWDNKTVYKGVMAQELVDTKYSSALNTDKDGFYYVDYSQLPITFEEV